MSERKEQAKDKVEQADEKIRSSVHNVAEKVNEKIESFDSEEIKRLEAELASLKQKAGPKIQEAENFLTSPSAISFYKGLITGVAIVVAYNKVYSKY